MLLYIHVPFCRRKCAYCSFYSEPLIQSAELIQALSEGKDASGHLPGELVLPAGRDRMQTWLDGVLLEMAQWGDALDRPEISTVFFGGGTPSMASPDMIKVILDRANRYFRLDPKAEITLEANPESITQASARGYIRAGINRVSLGVQALDDGLLQFMGRVHNVHDVHRAYNALRGAYCRNISLDLIWGLPGQSVNSWLGQLTEIIRLKPEHISCYGLTVEPGTPLAQWQEDGLFTLPPERDQATMYVRGAEVLEEAGFLHYEISNFARMGYQSRHNTGYWEGEDYLGIGPAATSTVNGRRWTNPADLAAWARQVDMAITGENPEVLTTTDRVLELLMLRLRTTRGLRFKAYRALTGRDFLKDHKQLVHTLHRHRLIRIRNGYLWLTRNGMLVSNSILERFFQSAKEKLATPLGSPPVVNVSSPDAPREGVVLSPVLTAQPASGERSDFAPLISRSQQELDEFTAFFNTN